MEDNTLLYKSLKDKSFTLEAKVEELTQELKIKNEQLEQAQQQLQLAQEQIVAQEKLVDLGTRIAEVAHDLKSPFHYINLCTEVFTRLVDDLKEDIEYELQDLNSEVTTSINEFLCKIAENAAAIKQQVEKGFKVADSVLLQIRVENSEQELVEPEPELTTLNELIESSSALAYLSFEDKYNNVNISLETECAPSVEQIEVGQDISRALTNLIENACYAVYIKKRAIKKLFQPKVSINAEDLGDSIEITIKDNGQGIPQEMLEKIFDSRFTTKPSGEGTGLGLSIAREIIENHRGKITVESQPGAYTKFIVVLPLN